MDSVGPVNNSPEKVKPSQPSLTKKGFELQDKSGNPSSEAEKVTNPETNTPPKTPPENSIDVTA
jgi:hypothetical protein